MSREPKEESVREAPEVIARKSDKPPVARAVPLFQNKRGARIEYYQGIRHAMLEHAESTEKKIRNLEGLRPGKADKLVADLQKTHEKLLKRIDNQIRQERAGNS